jgi:hypothetical protein
VLWPRSSLSRLDCLSLARVSHFGRWGTWTDKWCEDGSEVEEEEEERSAREESSSEGESSEGESSSESRALRLWKRSATKHCREVAMELIGSWQFGDPVENAWLPRLPWPVVMLIARLSVAVPRPE